jgi:hypothetical protein
VGGKKKRKVFIYRFFPMCSHHVLNEFSNSLKRGFPSFQSVFSNAFIPPRFLFLVSVLGRNVRQFFYKKKGWLLGGAGIRV